MNETRGAVARAPYCKIPPYRFFLPPFFFPFFAAFLATFFTFFTAFLDAFFTFFTAFLAFLTTFFALATAFFTGLAGAVVGDHAGAGAGSGVLGIGAGSIQPAPDHPISISFSSAI